MVNTGRLPQLICTGFWPGSRTATGFWMRGIRVVVGCSMALLNDHPEPVLEGTFDPPPSPCR